MQTNAISRSLCVMTETRARLHRRARAKALLNGYRAYVLEASDHSRQFVLTHHTVPDTWLTLYAEGTFDSTVKRRPTICLLQPARILVVGDSPSAKPDSCLPTLPSRI